MVADYTGSKTIEVPTLTINKRKYTQIKDLHFKHSVGGKPIKEETVVQCKYDEDYLYIQFECRDNPRTDQNYYTKDNTKMYTQEVFELFISNGSESLEDYMEIQLNPNNALYLSKIANTYKHTKKFVNIPVETKSSGIVHSVTKNKKDNSWKGFLKIPLRLLKYPKAISDNTFRLNFYRIISNEDHEKGKWRVDQENATFACWSSTLAEKPAFHRPDYFGFLILD